MVEDAVRLLRCPKCRADGSFAASAAASDAREIRTGVLRCEACGHCAEIRSGAADLLYDPPEFVVREAEGLKRFAQLMRDDGWDRERVLNLPYEDSPFWHGQRGSFEQLERLGAWHPGQRILDIGSNTCWASARFAKLGLDAVALDISMHEMQGLETADWWMQRDGTHFERVLGPMFAMPLASGSFDHVFCCEVLHHNSLRNLHRTLSEAFRVLKPGGRLSVIRESLRAPGNLQLHPGHEVAEFEGYEHAFLAASYLLAARRAGFTVEVLEPAHHWVLSDEPFTITPQTRRRARFKLRVLDRVRRHPAGRRWYRRYLHHVAGSVPFSFIATKRVS